MSRPASSTSRAHAEPSQLEEQCKRALEARGITFRGLQDGHFEVQFGERPAVPCILLADLPSPEEASALASGIAANVETRGATLLLVALPLETAGGKKAQRNAQDAAAALALLRARGGIVIRDPSVFLEAAVLLAGHGMPAGPNGAIVATPGSWLALSAASLQHRAESLGERFSPLAASLDPSASTDFVLTDQSPGTGSAKTALIVPVGLAADAQSASLVGLAAALEAAEEAGQASRRIAAGDGPAEEADAPYEDIDEARFDRQLDKLHESAGDHECKVLLSSYGVAITRQAVATTPSAATRIAKKAGYPVEIKAWGPDQPSEADGAIVLSDIQTAAEVRRAFGSVCSRSQSEAVIIRETPMPGREIRVEIRPVAGIGYVCFLFQRGQRTPAAALAPLRPMDADSMARRVAASRSGDLVPDWEALAKLLVHASHMAADNERILSLELGRIIVGYQGEGAVVVDAKAQLRV